MSCKNAFYAQSGGVSAVINASPCGVLQTARKHGCEIGKVYAGRNGIIGALTEDLIDTMPDAAIAALRQTPAAVVGCAGFVRKRVRELLTVRRGQHSSMRIVNLALALADAGLPRAGTRRR
jgi:6-phosphofructokinase 1